MGPVNVPRQWNGGNHGERGQSSVENGILSEMGITFYLYVAAEFMV